MINVAFLDAEAARRLQASLVDNELDSDAAYMLVEMPLEVLMAAAEQLTLQGFGRTVTYSRKVFIPLTQLCRDVCHYCTFAKAPRGLPQPYLSVDEAVAIARAGVSMGCKEALFTLGDKPELRYSAARKALDAMGYTSTLDYLAAVAKKVYEETGLLPHLNPGVMNAEEMAHLREVSVSMGTMLETTTARLSERGGPHWGSPDKDPIVRLKTLHSAGELAIPFTTGLLIGIGETRSERIDALLAIRDLHQRFGHIQEVIIQNFCPKPGTKMANVPEPAVEEQLWTIAVARLILGSSMSIQAPPNLQPNALEQLVRAGINDWGGVSPLTPDHVNPEAPWPQITHLSALTAGADRVLAERLAIVPSYAQKVERWVAPALRTAVLRACDAGGFTREDDWIAGSNLPPPKLNFMPSVQTVSASVQRTLVRAARGDTLDEGEIVALFQVRGADFDTVIAAADTLRRDTVGDTVTYVANRNINYTNICTYRCGFCAFSKGSGRDSARGPAYSIGLDEIAQRTREAAQAGATEVCLQGGIHPDFTGQTYLDILGAVKSAVPSIHVHAFSPLEVMHGARSLGRSLSDFLGMLRDAGLSTLPGTAAEILDDEVRALICPDKLTANEWLDVVSTAHQLGLKTTATIMFGHVDRYEHWARHLLRVREVQLRTGGFTEFVPLPFVHMEAPMWRKGLARSGPTFREVLLMHAVARLTLYPLITNLQASWVKLGAEGVKQVLLAGVNDLGGTLMNESITRSAGGCNGQEFTTETLIALANTMNRPARQRTTLYGIPATHEPVVEKKIFALQR